MEKIKKMKNIILKKVFFLFTTLILILNTACSLTVPVRGSVQNTDEAFTGTATGYLDRSGVLTITSNKGTTCTGNFVYATARQGEGVFICDDGRSGPFTFVSTGLKGTGYGDLGGSRFTFTFGN